MMQDYFDFINSLPLENRKHIQDYTKQFFYIFILKTKNKTYHLIWIDDESPNKFMTLTKNEFLISDTENDIRNICDKNFICIEKESKTIFDISQFFDTVSKLHHNKKLSTEDSNIILNGIDHLDDMERTLKDKPTFHLHKIIYDKLFYGCNLPSITKDNKKYHPIFSKKELQELKNKINITWATIRQISGQFM